MTDWKFSTQRRKHTITHKFFWQKFAILGDSSIMNPLINPSVIATSIVACIISTQRSKDAKAQRKSIYSHIHTFFKFFGKDGYMGYWTLCAFASLPLCVEIFQTTIDGLNQFRWFSSWQSGVVSDYNVNHAKKHSIRNFWTTTATDIDATAHLDFDFQWSVEYRVDGNRRL